MRFALVHPGDQVPAARQIASRLRGGTITTVVEPNESLAKRAADALGISAWAVVAQELHQRHGDLFDAWAVRIPEGWLIADHDNRPFSFRRKTWEDLAAGWVWGCTDRFLPSVRTIKESLDSGKLGTPGLVRIHRWREPLDEDDAMELIVPQLDLSCWLIDQPPTVLFAQAQRAPDAGRPPHYVQVHLGFADDRMALIDCTTALPDGHTNDTDSYNSLSVIGSTGAAYADDHHNRQLVFKGDLPRAVCTPEDDLTLLAIVQEFLDAKTAKRPPLCGVAEWKRAQWMREAVETSLNSGQSVALGGAP